MNTPSKSVLDTQDLNANSRKSGRVALTNLTFQIVLVMDNACSSNIQLIILSALSLKLNWIIFRQRTDIKTT